jgi:hypothetical protein
MRIKLSIISFLFFAITGVTFAGFSARLLNGGSSGYTVHIQKLETKIEAYGLFYETTINVKLKLDKVYSTYWDGTKVVGVCLDPTQGKYEFIWNFSLNKNSYIKDLQVWSNTQNRFIKTAMMSLSEGEQKYNPNTTNAPSVLLKQYMRRDYNGSYNLQYDLKISPVNWDESAEFIIKYISPCTMNYDKRILETKSSQFFVYGNTNCYQSEIPKYFVIDYNNTEASPQYFTGNAHTWTKQNGFWYSDEQTATDFKFYMPTESVSGKFLKTSGYQDLKFYQLATLPFIADGLRPPRKIVVALDLIQNNYNEYTRSNFLKMIKDALLISTMPYDSLVFVTSDFNTRWLNSFFMPRSESFFTGQLETVNQVIPKLNTLPYMLKDIVEYLNDVKTQAEVWIVSDDYRTGVRAETVMDLLNQTLYKAIYKVKFSVVDAATSYSSYYIQNKYYSGNEYLYENLTRLSGGNFIRLSGKYYLNYIDEVLDCFAPQVSTVEIDPILANGFTHSRINLNSGRNNFNITSRYFQAGVLDGTPPINLQYYGFYNNSNYKNIISLTEDNTTIPTSINQNTGLYWYGNYIMTDLFLQPQSYTTIKYIEQLSVQNNILTPYSAFVLPGPDGYNGFKRAYEEELLTGIEKPKEEIATPISVQLSMSSYPNPFNPQTAIIVNVTSELIDKEKELHIYNLLGQRIKNFDLSQYLHSSQIKVEWDGTNETGNGVTSGIYFAVFRCNAHVKSIKLQLIR